MSPKTRATSTKAAAKKAESAAKRVEAASEAAKEATAVVMEVLASSSVTLTKVAAKPTAGKKFFSFSFNFL
jgi:C4-type Zn-finger protein